MLPNQAKALLPRLKAPLTPTTRRRVKQACDTCRNRKGKCDGRRPTCGQCEASGTECIYSDAKRTKERKELELAKSKIKRYEGALREISRKATTSLIGRGDVALHPSSSRDETSDHETGQQSFSASASSSSSSFVGSLEGIDVADEDVNRNEESRATGFIGKNSELSWMRTLWTKSKKANDDRSDNPFDSWNNEPMHTINYYLDNMQISVSENVDQLALPPQALAEHLLEAYMDSVNESLPLIRSSLFRIQVRRFYSQVSARPGKNWLAILNLVFAIGMRYLQLSQMTFATKDHQVFFLGAQKLCTAEDLLYDHPDLQQVQIKCLLALYFLSTAQINRAWQMIGTAVRSAIALGINLRTAETETQYASNEARCRLWWSIFTLEHLLSNMTGRVSCLGENSYSVYPPMPFEEDRYRGLDVLQLFRDSKLRRSCLRWTLYFDKEKNEAREKYLRSAEITSSLFYYHITDLSMISHAVSEHIYTVRVSDEGWAVITDRIRQYNTKLDQWLETLALPFRFIDGNNKLLPNLESRRQTCLAFHYFSVRIILNRPCFPYSMTSEENSFRYRSPDSSSQQVFGCMSAALSTLSLLPDEVEIQWLYTRSPWWCVLHLITQSMTILLLYMSAASKSTEMGGGVHDIGDGTTDNSQSSAVVVAACQKALTWLSVLGTHDEAAQRAFTTCRLLFVRLASNTAPEVVSNTAEISPRLEYRDRKRSLPNGFDPQDQRPQIDSNIPRSIAEENSFGLESWLMTDKTPLKARSNSSGLTGSIDLDMSLDMSDITSEALNEVLLPFNSFVEPALRPSTADLDPSSRRQNLNRA